MPKTSQPDRLPLPNHIFYLTHSTAPLLEILEDQDETPGVLPRSREAAASIPFTEAGEGREAGESLWAAEFPKNRDSIPTAFRIRIEEGRLDPPEPGRWYETPLKGLWLQDGQVYSYRPAPQVSPSQVIKIPYFQGSLHTRPLYVYLPRGYADHPEADYPVLYMQDGQNTFERYVEDSYVGSWRAEEVADRMIAGGRMQECLIVGVSHGGEERLAEYLPPYAKIQLERRRFFRSVAKSKRNKALRSLLPLGKTTIFGRADRTFDYYEKQVAPFIAANYRTRPGRDHTALCGSSIAGLFSLYVAWEHTEFARNYAALSPSFAATREKAGRIPILDRLHEAPLPDIRLWLDSGTMDLPGVGDDGFLETLKAREILLQRGMVEGDNFHYRLDQGGIHNEASWSSRLPTVLEFLFPLNPSSPSTEGHRRDNS
jgi:predicted alpha/beta superfamily hydrolase